MPQTFVRFSYIVSYINTFSSGLSLYLQQGIDYLILDKIPNNIDIRRGICKDVSWEAEVLFRPNQQAVIESLQFHSDTAESVVSLVETLSWVRVKGFATKRVHEVWPVASQSKTGADFSGGQNKLK